MRGKQVILIAEAKGGFLEKMALYLIKGEWELARRRDILNSRNKYSVFKV